MHNHAKPPGKPVTAREIALTLGISQSTVSRVLQGAPGYTFAEETRAAVLAEAERVGYQPNAVGRSLRERRTRVVGYYIHGGALDARNSFQAEIIGSLQSACLEAGYFVLLHTFPARSPAARVAGELTSGRVDGLIVHTQESDPVVRRLAAGSVPAVAVADCVPQLPSVLCDDADGVRQALEHLATRGHRRIAFIHPDVSLASVNVRLAAYCAERASLGLEATCIRVHFEDAEPALDALLALPDRPTAVLCWNDVTAMNVVRTCHRRGLRVPQDLAVVGFDGLLDRRIVVQELTTVDADWPQVTRAALRALQVLLQGGSVPPITRVPVSLRIGETT